MSRGFGCLQNLPESFRRRPVLSRMEVTQRKIRTAHDHLEKIIEMMGNAARHNADNPVKIQVNVQLAIEDSLVKVVVSDNGKGFDTEAAAQKGGLGLKLIRDRAEMLGGYFEVDSREGQGCRVTFQVATPETTAAGLKS